VTPALLRWWCLLAGCLAVVVASVQASALSLSLAGVLCISLALALAVLGRHGRRG